MSLTYGINKITSKITSTMKKKQLLTAFLDKYSNLLDTVCNELDNDINIATIITIVNSIKKRNPKLIIELWYKNVAIKFIDMKISQENFQDKAEEFVNVIQGDQYFSEAVKVSTQNLFFKFKHIINKERINNSEIFEKLETVVKLSILYHNVE
tara:strand:+ start:245 stop:703 length:459 start_codon:yes stop_codon:yes gene_type:complete